MPNARVMEVETLIRPVVEGSGLELFEVELLGEQGRRILRVTVDREGGVDLDAIAEASERIGRRLDLEGFDAGGRYELEVSSPGLERPLREPRHFARAVGERVKVKAAVSGEAAETFTGTVAGADDDAVTVSMDGGVERRVLYGAIRSARTVFEWGPQTTKTKAKGGRR